MKKLLVYGGLILLLVLAFSGSVMGEFVYEKFNNPLGGEWDYVNNTNCNVTFVNDGGDNALILEQKNDTSGLYCGYTYYRYVNMSADFVYHADVKVAGQCCGTAGFQGGIYVQQYPAPDTPIVPMCGFAFYTTGTSPDDRYRKTYYTPTFTDITNPLLVVDSDWHNLRMEWDSSENNMSYYFDGLLKNTVVVTSDVCAEKDNVSLVFGILDQSAIYDNRVEFDNVYFVGDVVGELPLCEFSLCTDKCLFLDMFDYPCTFEQMSYYLYPNDPYLVPDDFSLCVDTAQTQSIYKDVEVSQYFDVITESFDLNINGNASNVGHTLSYYNDASEYSINVVSLQFVMLDEENTSIKANSGGTLSTICINCWELGREHEYSITHFNFDTKGRTFYNSSSETYEPILPHTLMIMIDDNVSKLYANIPVTQELVNNRTDTIDMFSFSFYNTDSCVDNYYIEAPDYVSGTQEAKTLADIGDYCHDDSDCLTGKCEYHRCVKKTGGLECEFGWQCLSGECVNGICNNPTLIESLTQAKDSQFGDDKSTSTFISLFIMIGIPVLLIFAGRSTLSVVAGIVVYYALAGLFTIMGWLEPFILVLSILSGLILVVLAVVIGTGGD